MFLGLSEATQINGKKLFFFSFIMTIFPTALIIINKYQQRADTIENLKTTPSFYRSTIKKEMEKNK